jgi:hypothetical protein
MRKRWPALLLLALLPVTYFLYYLDAGKPRTVLWDVMDRRNRRDLDGARRRFADRVQIQWQGAWQDATDANLKDWMMWNWDPAPGGDLRGFPLLQFIDPEDPLHRYVRSDADWARLGFCYVRLAWTGVGWKVDGLWYSTCVIPEEQWRFVQRLIKVG